MKLDKQKIIIISLIVLLLFLVQYIIYDNFIQQMEVDLVNAFQDGYQQGLIDAVSEIFMQTENCVVTTITIGNLTKNVVDYSCLENTSEYPSP